MKTALIVLFGILLPAVTLVVELAGGMCAETFFDPIPTLGHALLVAFVPLANVLALACPTNTWNRRRTSLLWANGVALGIALVYTLVFLPLTPLGLLGIVFMGMGLLPLAPLCSLLCAVALRKRLLTNGAGPAPTTGIPSLLLGGALGVLLLALAESPLALTHVGMQMVASDSASEQARGLGLLRAWGNQDEMLRLCYEDRSRSMSSHLFHRVSRDDAQRVFFRVTGEPYNAQPRPDRMRQRGRSEFAFDFDPDLGAQAVAGRRKGLSLGSSRMDVQLHGDAAAVYLEWTMVLLNDRPQQQEARAQILLPPGGVVSRVTLWVHGEPREAAFSATGQVREAYRKVAVVQRRDPLLVTWAGADRVLAQCFPVPANGEMKILLGITAPLVLSREDEGMLRLPCFAERNFSINAREPHSLWIASDQPFRNVSAELRVVAGDSPHALRGVLSDEQLASADGVVRVVRSATAAETWTPDRRNTKHYVAQKVVTRRPPAESQVVLVIDGSVGMAEHLPQFAEALAEVSAATQLRVLVAADEVVDVSDEAAQRAAGPGPLAARLRAVAGFGGCNNVRALDQALEQAPGGPLTIVWIHTAQPVLLESATPLVQWLQRDTRITLYDFPVAAGPNRVVEELKNVRALRTALRLGTVRDDLKDLLARLTEQATVYDLQRSLVEGDPPALPKTTSHVARLWASDEVNRLAQTGKPADLAEAGRLAASYLLVTPVTGAVVLETRQQYKEADLEPADPNAVPAVPEPGTWVLVLAGLPCLLWFLGPHRRSRGRAA